MERETEFSIRLKQREEAAGLRAEDLAICTREEAYTRLKQATGQTPIRITDLPNGNIFLQKLELLNPTESHYDRCYPALLEALEKEGTIKPGDRLLETTSGSAGISFGWVCQKLGYDAHVFMPGFVPEPRIVEVRRFSEVHLSNDPERYLQASAEEMAAYRRTHKDEAGESGQKIWMPNHSQDFRTPGAFATIADEVAESGQQVDYFIGGVGNGSTLLGVGQRVKKLWPNGRVIGYEPSRACPFYLAHKDRWGSIAPKLAPDSDIPAHWQPHDMPGTGGFGNINFPFMNQAIQSGVIDDILHVPDDRILKSVCYNDELPPELQQGHTSLVSRFIAEQMAERVRGKVFMSLAYDRADRYGEPRYV